MRRLISLFLAGGLAIGAFGFPAAAALPGVSRLQSHIGGLLASPSLSANGTGVAVVSLKSGQLLYGRNATRPLMPASNLKLLTSAAALTLLGPDFAFRTAVYADAPVTDGFVGGRLYMKGFGDPDLDQGRIEAIAGELYRKGVRQVGDVVADESFFDSQRRGLGWKARYEGMSYSAPISALSVTQNVQKIWIKGSAPGSAAALRLEPDSDYYQLVNEVRTVAGYANRVAVIPGKMVNGRQQLIVRGVFGMRTPQDALSFNISEPPLVTGGALIKAMKKAGIRVSGQLSIGQTPATAVPLVINGSRPLALIMQDFNKDSINFIGEQVLKYLGATYRSEPGTAAKGADVIKQDFMRRLVGVDPTGMVIADGSGLSTVNRVSAAQFAGVLRYMYQQPDYRLDYQESLATAGVDGTLRHRFRATPAQGVLQAKTGFINGVCTLSGYTVTRDGEPVAFSFLMNDYKDLWAVRTIQDKLGVLLTQFRAAGS